MARPLTKEVTGKLYTRPPDVEAKIDVALAQDQATLLRRAVVTDRASPDYLPSECLVHLIRVARRRNDQVTMSMLVPVLLTRCEANLFVKVPDSGFHNAADIREEVIGQFAELFAIDGSDEDPAELDYFECKFNRAFRAFRIDLVRKEISHLKYIASYPTEAEEDPKALDAVFTHLSAAELRAAIKALPPDERQALVLCNILGYQEESEDPKKQTAATLCGVTGRTIRNRLHRAASKLSKLKEDV